MSDEDLILSYKNKDVFLKVLSSPYDFKIDIDQPYVCMLFINDDNISKETRDSVIKKIVYSNCRWAICTGNDCVLWEDIVDWIELERWDYNVPDGHIMTTSHPGESVEDVLWFGLESTSYDEYDFQEYVILQLGKDDILSQKIMNFVANPYMP